LPMSCSRPGSHWTSIRSGVRFAGGNEQPARTDGTYYLSEGRRRGNGVMNVGIASGRRQARARRANRSMRLQHGRATRANGIHDDRRLHRPAVSSVGGQFPVRQTPSRRRARREPSRSACDSGPEAASFSSL
jgi:hypothetical protein